MYRKETFYLSSKLNCCKGWKIMSAGNIFNKLFFLANFNKHLISNLVHLFLQVWRLSNEHVDIFILNIILVVCENS